MERETNASQLQPLEVRSYSFLKLVPTYSPLVILNLVISQLSHQTINAQGQPCGGGLRISHPRSDSGKRYSWVTICLVCEFALLASYQHAEHGKLAFARSRSDASCWCLPVGGGPCGTAPPSICRGPTCRLTLTRASQAPPAGREGEEKSSTPRVTFRRRSPLHTPPL